jgi:hypothetical protein
MTCSAIRIRIKFELRSDTVCCLPGAVHTGREGVCPLRNKASQIFYTEDHALIFID